MGRHEVRSAALAELNPFARQIVRFLLLRNPFGLDAEATAAASPMQGFEDGHWGSTPVLLTSASSEFLLPWASQQAAYIFRPKAGAAALRRGGAQVIEETVLGCHFAYIGNMQSLLDNSHRFWRLVYS